MNVKILPAKLQLSCLTLSGLTDSENKNIHCSLLSLITKVLPGLKKLKLGYNSVVII